MAVEEIAVQAVSQLLTSWGGTFIRNWSPGERPDEPAPDAPGETPLLAGPDGEGCPVCRLHRELAEARSLLEGIAERAEAEGGVPAGLGGTLLLAEQCYVDARARLHDTQLARADLRARCEQVGIAIAEAEAAVPDARSARPRELRDAAGKATRAWRSAYDLAWAYYKGPEDARGVQTRDLMGEWFDQSRREGWDRETALARLQEALGG